MLFHCLSPPSHKEFYFSPRVCHFSQDGEVTSMLIAGKNGLTRGREVRSTQVLVTEVVMLH